MPTCKFTPTATLTFKHAVGKSIKLIISPDTPDPFKVEFTLPGYPIVYFLNAQGQKVNSIAFENVPVKKPFTEATYEFKKIKIGIEVDDPQYSSIETVVESTAGTADDLTEIKVSKT